MAGAPGFNIGSLFRAGQNVQPAPAAAPAAPAAPARTAVGNMDNQPPNPGADPMNQDLGDAGLDNAGKPKKESSPLDAFQDVFTIDPKKPAPTDPLAEKLFNFDPKKLMESVAKMNFAAGVTPEAMQAIQGGDAAALTKVLNGTGQSAFASAIQMLIPIMEQSITKNNARFKSILASEVRNVQINQGRPENAALNHPAAQPVLGALKTQISSQFPDMTPSEVTKKAEDYFLAMSKAVTSGMPQETNADGTPKKVGPKEADYSAFLDLG